MVVKGGEILNYFEYTARTKNFDCYGSVEFNPGDSKIEKVIIEVNDKDSISIKFVFSDLVNAKIEEVHDHIEKNLLDSLINKIIFNTHSTVISDVSIDRLVYRGNIEVYGGKVDINCKAKIVTTYDINNLKQIFESKYVNNNGWYNMYRVVHSIKDPKARYMLLYGIITLMHNNLKQWKIDKIINAVCQKNNIPVEYRDNNKYKNNEDTIYTWLRNEIGHPVQATKPEEVFKEIEVYVEHLSQIVKIIIKEKTNK